MAGTANSTSSIKAQAIPGTRIPGGVVIGGLTTLLDVWTPSPLVTLAPSFQYPDHHLKFTFGDEVSSAQQRSKTSRFKRNLSKKSTTAHQLKDSQIYYDCRHDSTSNVAHLLQNQIAVALTGLDTMGVGDRWNDLVFVVHDDTPDYARQLYEALGFQVFKSSEQSISGTRINMKPLKFPLRAIASGVLRTQAIRAGILTDDDQALPPVFLSRRSRRTLTNMDQIEPLLKADGYQTVYAEDLSIEQQIQTIANASKVWGLHGAAMGYLMLSDPAKHCVVTECFPGGYATNWARAICSVVGNTWVGGQGDLGSQLAARFSGDASPRAFESSDYRLDPLSVKLLIRIANKADRIGRQAQIYELIEEINPVDIQLKSTPSGEGQN